MKHKPLALLFAATLLCHSLIAAPVSGIEFNNFDPQIRFQDDLYAAVNGRWEQTTTIPADQASYGTFNQLRDLSEQRSRTLIEQLLKQSPRSADEQKIADLYADFMQESTANRLGARPILPDLARINAIDSLNALTRLMGKLQSTPLSLPLQFSVAPDAKDASHTLLQVSQGGLGLPDRDYYLDKQPRFVAARQAYLRYLETLFALVGLGTAQHARNVLALETRLAEIQWSAEANRDVQKTYNPVSRSALGQISPDLNWRVLLRAADLALVTKLNVAQPDYVHQLGVLMRNTPIEVWRDYLRAHTLDSYAPLLSRPFVDAHFAFHQQALAGIQQQSPRWKRAVALVERSMGQALGKRYVAQYFPPEAKRKINNLVATVMRAYQQSIASLDWMSPATREQARLKLAQYHVKIAYPDQWQDYSALTIRRHDLVGNVRRASAYHYRYNLNKLGRPVDRNEWQMTPQTVNAYYDLQLNEIVFPAAILQPPFFNPDADDAVNYGGIGAVIGHEVSHGFDDQGSQFDGAGNLRNWWSAEDRRRYKERTDKLVAQYNAYQPLAGYHVNGKLTLGENIADNAGLQIAYKAYQLSLNGAKAPVIDGLSGDQRFFIGFAQVWRNKMHEARLLRLLVNDPHTPAHFRPAGAVVNSDAFYQAFDVKPTDKMYKPAAERIRLW